MKRRSTRLLEIRSPIEDAATTLRLLEPADSCQVDLRERVYSGSYGKPFVVDNGRRRFLHFDFGSIQSAMDVRDPVKLALAYTRKMMAFLLFKSNPERLLLLGLGGGSIAKFCYRNLPDSCVTAVEVDSDVIALRDEFCIPTDDHRFRVIHADGAAHLSRLAQRKDVIIVDAYDRAGMASALDSPEFYLAARDQLSTGGVFVANLCGDNLSMRDQLARIREAFENEVLTVRVRKDENLIVFGFKARHPGDCWESIERGAEDLKRRHLLDFPRYARRIAADSKLQTSSDRQNQ